MPNLASSAARAGVHGALLSMRDLSCSRGQEKKSIAVHLADCNVLRNRAGVLLNKMYAWRGYGADHKLSSGENRAIFTASAGDQVIGTLTLTVDTPARLATDHTFKDELDELRKAPGTTLCELTKFAVDPEIKSPAVLAALFHVIFIYGIEQFGCTDVVIEVHPRHVRYYEAMLGFERVGAPKLDASVEWWPSDTPVQLLRLNLRRMRRLIDGSVGDSHTDGRSLYPHFFSQEEEYSIAARIGRLGEAKELNPALAPKRERAAPGFWREAA